MQYDVIVLNPHTAQDYEVLASTLEAASIAVSTDDFIWLPADSTNGDIRFADLASRADDMETRSGLRECLSLLAPPVPVRANLPQTLVLRLRVGADGDVTGVSVTARTIADRDVVTCIMQYVMGWRFRQTGANVSFDVPLALIASPADN